MEVFIMKRESFMSRLYLIALVLVSFAAFAKMPAEEEKSEKPNPAVAKFDGKILYMDELVEGARIRGGFRFRGAGAERLRTMKSEELENFVKDYVFNQKLTEEAIKSGFDKDPDIKKQIERVHQQTFASILYQNEVIKKIITPSPEEVKQYYEDHKTDEFRQPFSFKMRHIFLSTYKHYTAKKGDTLEGIAGKISGDKKMVKHILTDDENKKPRYVKPEERKTKLFRPLQPGEKLLVPMNKEEEETVYKHIKAIYNDLKNGADFVRIAKEKSESGPDSGQLLGPITPSKDKKQMLPEIIEAVKKTPVGKFSDIIETKHGYNIIKVEEKTEEGYYPFERVKRTIENRLSGKRRNERAKEFLGYVSLHTPGVSVNKDVFTAADRTSDSVIIAIGDEIKFTLADFHTQIPEFMRKQAKTSDEKLDRVIESRPILLPLLAKYAESKNLADAPEFKSQLENHKIQVLSEKYIRKLMDDLPKPTEDDLRDYYENNKEQFTDPQNYDLSMMGLKIKERGEKPGEEEQQTRIARLKKKLEGIRKTLKTKEDFEKAAEKYSQDPATNKSKGSVGFVPASYRGGFDGRMNKMKPGEVSEPFVYGNFVYIIRVNEIKPERLRPFSECRGAVKRNFTSERRREFREKKKGEILKACGFEFLMKG